MEGIPPRKHFSQTLHSVPETSCTGVVPCSHREWVRGSAHFERVRVRVNMLCSFHGGQTDPAIYHTCVSLFKGRCSPEVWLREGGASRSGMQKEKSTKQSCLCRWICERLPANWLVWARVRNPRLTKFVRCLVRTQSLYEIRGKDVMWHSMPPFVIDSFQCSDCQYDQHVHLHFADFIRCSWLSSCFKELLVFVYVHGIMLVNALETSYRFLAKAHRTRPNANGQAMSALFMFSQDLHRPSHQAQALSNLCHGNPVWRMLLPCTLHWNASWALEPVQHGRMWLSRVQTSWVVTRWHWEARKWPWGAV